MKQYEYISVYKSDETDFSYNGIRILCPTECKITEVLNGEYSLTLTHPFDDLGNWKFLIEYNIIKVPKICRLCILHIMRICPPLRRY